MTHKGLSQEAVVLAAAELIERRGRAAFSMRLLADKLEIKTASLYNHVEGMDGLLAEVCRYTLRQMQAAELCSIEGKHGEETVYAMANTCRRFAKEHRELYWLTMELAARDSRVLDDAAVSFTEPIKQMLRDFNLREEYAIHFRRLFRAVVHGFVSQEDEGFFSHYPVSSDESFEFAVRCFIDNLKREESRRGDE